MQCICNNILCAGEQGVGEGENGVKPLTTMSDFDLVIVMYTFVLYLKYKN